MRWGSRRPGLGALRWRPGARSAGDGGPWEPRHKQRAATCVCTTGSGKEDSTSRASSLKNQVGRPDAEVGGGGNLSTPQSGKSPFYRTGSISGSRGSPFFSGAPAGATRYPEQIVTGAGRAPKPGKGDARRKKQWRSGPQLNAACRAAASGALLLGFHRPRRRFAEQIRAARAEAVRTNKKRMPLRAVPLATALRPRRRGFEAAELRPLSFPVGFR